MKTSIKIRIQHNLAFAGLICLSLQQNAKADENRPYIVEGSDPYTGAGVIETNYPFATESLDSIKEYFDNRTWKDGSKRSFYKLRNCRFTHNTFDDGITHNSKGNFRCNADYDEDSSLGKRTCLNGTIGYDGRWYRGEYKQGGYHFMNNGSQCNGWQKVAATPEPQSQATPPPQPQTSTTTSTTLNKNLIIAGGAGILVLGGLLGVAFSQLLGLKKK